jgi:creatinine amidohydrolase
MVVSDISCDKEGRVAGQRSILFAELTRTDLAELAPRALVVVPLGATEQHGPHLPTGTDFFHAEWVARDAATRVADRIPIVVTPTLPFGSSEHHFPFGGTISFPSAVYLDAVGAIVESLVRDGFTKIFLVNGHGGNHELIQVAARDAALRLPVAVAASSWWNAAWEVLLDAGAHEVGRLPGHAGGFETSLVMAMHPSLVDSDRMPDRQPTPSGRDIRFPALVRDERHGFWQSIEGFSDGPRLANEAAGKRWLDVAAEELARLYLAFFEAPMPEPLPQASKATKKTT